MTNLDGKQGIKKQNKAKQKGGSEMEDTKF